MKIQYISDVHAEFYENEINDNPLMDFKITGDTLVIAGDLSVGTKVIPILKRLTKNNPNKHIVYVPGNHEFYSGKVDSIKSTMERIKLAVDKKNVYVLYRNVASIEGVNFIGCVGWPDGSKGPMKIWKYMRYNDFHQVKGFTDNCTIWGTLDREFIKAKLDQLKRQKNIIVTHFLPAYELIEEQFKEDHMNPCFANDWINWIVKSKAKHWIYGHSHANIEKKIGDTNFYSNQRGYIHEINYDFNPDKYFEV